MFFVEEVHFGQKSFGIWPYISVGVYTRNLKLVNCLLVNFFTKMAIARNPEGFQVPGVVGINPTGLPELFQHPSNLNDSQKFEKIRICCLISKSQRVLLV